jgi:hypothetical protein
VRHYDQFINTARLHNLQGDELGTNNIDDIFKAYCNQKQIVYFFTTASESDFYKKIANKY